MRNIRPALAATLFLTLAANSGTPSAQVRAGGSSAADTPTFTRDVLPIFQASCQRCHRSGTSAPMSLVTYEEARPYARMIKQKVQNREMPPWFSHRGIGEYEDDVSLTDAQTATISNWVDAGAPRGNPSDAPPPVQWPASGTWQVGTPDLVLTAPAVTVPTSGPDLYPEVEVPTGLTDDRYLRSIEIVPENDPVVHHILIYNVDADAPSRAAPSDSDATGDGGGVRGTLLANLAKGGSPDEYRDGTARLLRKGARIRFQIHLHPNGKASYVEHAKVGFRFFPKGYVPKHLVTTKSVSNQAGLTIPPMESNVRSESQFTFERDATLVSFQPHMHYRGKRMTLEAELPSGEKRVLSDIDRFVQGWQLTYRYKNPPAFPAGTVLHVTAYHDNSPANKLNPDPTAVVTWGERTVDEMNIGWIDYYYHSESPTTEGAAANR